MPGASGYYWGCRSEPLNIDMPDGNCWYPANPTCPTGGPPEYTMPNNNPVSCSATQPGSTIRVDDRTVQETIPLTGSAFALTYVSNRVPGYKKWNRLETALMQ